MNVRWRLSHEMLAPHQAGAWRWCGGLLALLLLVAPHAAWAGADPIGVWLSPRKFAIQTFDCAGRLCGRMMWLQHPTDPTGALAHDQLNPDPALRGRLLCGQTVLWGLTPAGPNRWARGRLYNPDDGRTYRISAELTSADVFVTRVYLGVPLFGESWTFQRVPRLEGSGWC